MLTPALACALLAASQEEDARGVVREAARRTRAQASYEVAWSARLEAPRGDPVSYRGTILWASPGVLFSHHTASGGEDKKIVRVGSAMAWVHASLQNLWVRADEEGDPGAGRGLQNPDEVLDLLARSQGPAAKLDDGGAGLTLQGGELRDFLRGRLPPDSYDWARSKASLRLAIDAEHRLRKLECTATLISVHAEAAGAYVYRSTFDVMAYNAKRALEFRDEKGRPIGPPKKMAEEIRSLQALRSALRTLPSETSPWTRAWPRIWN